MSSADDSHVRPVPVSVVVAARLSWWVPGAALLLVGLSERGGSVVGLDGHVLVHVAEGAGVVGLAFGAGASIALTRKGPPSPLRRMAFFGTATSAIVLLLTQLAQVTGTLSAREAERELGDALEHAVHDAPGWSGGARFEDAVLHAVGIEPGETAARLLQREGPLSRVLMLGVDNAAGKDAVRLDVGGAVAVGSAGPLGHALSNDETTAHLRALPEEVRARGPRITVPLGAKLEGIIVLFDPSISFERMIGVDIRVNGSTRRVPGRYFTASEKHSIDARRGSGAVTPR